jgi:outer membrane biosynthesis protein TonB
VKTTESAAPAVGAVATSGELQGSLDKHVIRNVVRSNIEGVRDCYNRGLARDPSLTGRVVIQFVIGGDGMVVRSVVESSTLPVAERQTADCLAAAALNWRFPGPEGGGRIIVTYPFVLEPADDSEAAPAPTK